MNIIGKPRKLFTILDRLENSKHIEKKKDKTRNNNDHLKKYFYKNRKNSNDQLKNYFYNYDQTEILCEYSCKKTKK